MPKWYQSLSAPWSKKSESEKKIADLQSRLDNLADELEDDLADYDMKFEVESSQPTVQNAFSGTDQIIDVAALQRVFATEIWVYAAVMALAETVASLPLKLEKKTSVNKKVTDANGVDTVIAQEVWTDASGEKLFKLLQHPNPYATRAEFYMLLMIDLMTAGEYYVYLDAPKGVLMEPGLQTNDDPSDPFSRLRQRLAVNTPIEGMYRLPPAMMRKIPCEGKAGLEGYVMTGQTGEHAFGYPEIINVKLPNPLDANSGLSPLIPAFKAVLLDRYASEHMIRFYKSGARLGGVIETEKSLNKEQLSRFQRSFESNYTGRQNHHRTLILPPGMKYNMVEQNPAETALLEFCKHNREAVLAAFKVPPIKVGLMDNANYANARVQLKTFFTDSVKPKLTYIEDGFNLKSALLPNGSDYRMRFDLSGVEELQEDLEVKAKTGKAMLEAGVSVNEVRKDVWKKEAAKGGDIVPSIEAAKKGNEPSGFPNFNNLSAPAADTKTPEGQSPSMLAGLDGTQVTAVMNILGRVTRGRLEKLAAIELLVGIYGFPMDRAYKLVGLEPPVQPVALEESKEEKCECEGEADCECDKPKSLNDYLSRAIAGLAENEAVTPDFIAELTSLFHQANGVKDEKPASSTTRGYSHGFTKERIAAHWKGFIEQTAPMISKREAEVQKFFKTFETIVTSRIGKNLKAYGLHKVRTKADTDDILDLDAYDAAIAQFTKEVDQALLEAYKFGYNDTMATIKIQRAPAEQATAFLEKFAAKEVTQITETTRDQLRTVLTEAFASGASIGDVTKAVRAKFDEMSQGRAATIARTETLSAVSAGRQEKRDDIKAEYPQMKLKKIWVNSQDARVRDSHDDISAGGVGGEVVDVDEEFSNGLLYPRDPSGEAADVINCRCTEITFAAEDQDLIQQSLEGGGEPDDEGGGPGKGFKGPGDKGGAGSGCHGDHCGRPTTNHDVAHTEGGYNRPPVKQLAPRELTGGERNNFMKSDMKDDPNLVTKKGKDINLRDAQYFQRLAETELGSAVVPAMDHFVTGLKREDVDVISAKMRAKDSESLLNKMNGKWDKYTLNQVTDGIGARVVVRNMLELDKAVAKSERLLNMKAIEHEDFIARPQSAGYRAVHMLMRTPNGMIMELQIKTENQNTWSIWSHEKIYKPKDGTPSLWRDKAIGAYSKAVSDHLAKLDMGQVAGPRPEAPKDIKDRGLEFPWGKVNDAPFKR